MKAILLVRVSTSQQDFTDQEKEIYQMALSDGYKEEDIIAICEKESGIKLEEEERAGLNKMKEYIEKGGIGAVYCWEVSRIARKKKINFSVLDYLTKHNVQLRIKTPNISLFNSDGTINEGAEIVFTLFSQMAESEMRTKQERFKRARQSKKGKMLYIGGALLFGYGVVEERIEPNKNSELVKTIYNMYARNEFSYLSLARELIKRGLVNKSEKDAYKFVKFTLQNDAYTGKKQEKGYTYPQIISESQYERCREIAKRNTSGGEKRTLSKFYFGKSILVCPKCGRVMTAIKNQLFYKCLHCDDRLTVNINAVDTVLWNCALPIYNSRLDDTNQEEKREIRRNIYVLSKKARTAEMEIEKLLKRAEALEYKIFVEGTIDMEKGERFVDEIKNKIEEARKNLKEYEKQTEEYQRLMEEKPKYTDITSDEVKYKIIHETIKKAMIKKEGWRKYNMTITDTVGIEYEYKIDTNKMLITSPQGASIAVEERFTREKKKKAM